MLTERQKQLIFRTACEMVVSGVCQRSGDWRGQSLEGAAQQPVAGVFVTLKRGTHLRACCGYISPDVPLIEALQNAAHRTATNDTRLPPISATELPAPASGRFAAAQFSAGHTDRCRACAGRSEVGRHGLTIHRGGSRRAAAARRGGGKQLGRRDLSATRVPQGRLAHRRVAGRRCAAADVRSGAHRRADRRRICLATRHPRAASAVPPGGYATIGRALPVECGRAGAGGDTRTTTCPRARTRTCRAWRCR